MLLKRVDGGKGNFWGGFVLVGRLENKYDKNDILFFVGFFYLIYN